MDQEYEQALLSRLAKLQRELRVATERIGELEALVVHQQAKPQPGGAEASSVRV